MKYIMDFLSKIFSFLTSWTNKKTKELEIKNESDFKKAKIQKQVIEREDENEKIVSQIEDPKKKDLVLEEIRKRISK